MKKVSFTNNESHQTCFNLYVQQVAQECFLAQEQEASLAAWVSLKNVQKSYLRCDRGYTVLLNVYRG